MTSAAGTIRDRLFAKKVLQFLANLDDVPTNERLLQVSRLDESSEERQRVGESLVLLLDRLNDMEKPALLARAFQAFLQGQIDRSQFQGLAYAVDTITTDLLSEYRSAYEEHRLDQVAVPTDAVSRFFGCGLLTLRFEKIDTTAYWGDGSSRIAGTSK